MQFEKKHHLCRKQPGELLAQKWLDERKPKDRPDWPNEQVQREAQARIDCRSSGRNLDRGCEPRPRWMTDADERRLLGQPAHPERERGGGVV